LLRKHNFGIEDEENMNQRYFERSEDYKGSQTYQKVVNYGK
jgi:hypothetical protein